MNRRVLVPRREFYVKREHYPVAARFHGLQSMRWHRRRFDRFGSRYGHRAFIATLKRIRERTLNEEAAAAGTDAAPALA